MKKYFLMIFITILSLSLILSSCTTVDENDIETTDEITQIPVAGGIGNNTSSDESQAYPEKTDDNIIEPEEGKGASIYFNYDPVQVPQELVFDPNTVLDETMSVYTYDYGYGQGGNFYTINETEKMFLKTQLDDFLSIRWDEETSNLEYTYNEYTVVCKNENETVYSAINAVTVSPKKNKVSLEEFDKDPLGNDMIKDFVEYLEFDDPYVICYDRPESTSLTIDYYISDHSQNTENYDYIKIEFYNGAMLNCKAVRVNMGEKHGEYNTIPYSVALAQIKNAYPELDIDSAKAIAFMKYEYQQVIGADGSYGGNGYYSPCYRFFLKSTDPSVEGYVIVDVAMTDFKPGETIVLE